MATCDDCIHYDICIFHIKGDENKKCPHFKNKSDVVEVVRCKDCEHWNGIGFAENAGWCDKNDIGTLYDDFCSYGKKVK